MKIQDLNLEELFEKIDWTKLHIEQTLHPDYNDSIIIWAEDASIEVLSSNNYYDTDEYCLHMRTEGFNNVDPTPYAEGWTDEEMDEYDNHTGNYVESDTGRIMTLEEMVFECIEEGEWDDLYEHWKEKFRRDYEEDLRNARIEH